MTEKTIPFVYSSPDCFVCKNITRRFESKGIPFEERCVKSNPEYAEELKEAGYTTLPVVQYAGDQWQGFQMKKIYQIEEDYAVLKSNNNNK